MAHDVFVSYSDKDRLTVSGICSYLEGKGLRCFVAYRDIPKAVIWAGAITEAIHNCKIMVIVYSENFNQSKEVDREIQLCSDFEKPMLIFRLSPSVYSNIKRFYLSNINHLDAFPNPEKEFDKLSQSILRLLDVEDTDLESQPDNYSVNSEPVDIEEWNAPRTKIGRFIKSIFKDKSTN